jgi:hypothetical protein
MQLASLNKERIYVVIDISSARGIYVHRCCLCTDLFINTHKIAILFVVLDRCRIWFLILRKT